MKKLIFWIWILFIAIICPGKSMGKDAWAPFESVENPTLQVVSEPDAYATFNNDFTWKLVWRPEVPVSEGTEIELRSLNLRTYYNWQYTDCEIEQAEIIKRRPFEISPSYLFSINGQWMIVRAKLKTNLEPGDTLKIRLTAIPPHFADLYDAVSVYVNSNNKGDQEFIKAPRATAVLNVKANRAARFAMYSHPMPDINNKIRTVLSVEDRFGNQTEFDREVPVKLDWNGKTWAVKLKQSKIIFLDAPKDIGRLKACIATDSLSSRENINNGQIQKDKFVITGNPVWGRSPYGETAGFGEFHWHTEASGDGSGSLIMGLSSARDHLNMNYCMQSDHTPSREKWVYGVGVIEKFNENDKFATLFGWENSTSQGHDNYYFTNSYHPMVPYGSERPWRGKPHEVQDRLSELQANLRKGNKFIAIGHHTNSISEVRKKDGTPYWFAYPFTKGDNYHRLIEIFQTRGNMERDKYNDADLWRAWCGSNGSSVQDALEKGYKVGFTGGTDNHCSLPGRSFTFRKHAGGRMPICSRILTGTWIDRIERRSIWQGLYDRHTWAVWDTRAIVYFAVNESQSGDEIKVVKRAPLKAYIKISAEDTLQSIEIVSEKESVWVGSSDELDFEKVVGLGAARKNTHFYLRALQRNGGIIYASPVFVTIAEEK